MQALPFIELSADYVLVGGSLLRRQGNLLYSGTIPAGRIKGGLVYITDVEAAVTNILQVLAKYGADGHMWIPGIGVINGITANNWANTVGTVASVVGGPVARVNEQSGSFTASQATAGSQPVLRTDKYRWEFDGTNDHFTLPYSPFNMSNDFCIVAGAALVGSGTARSIYGQSNNSNHVLPDFGFNAGGQLGIAAVAGATTMSAYGGTSNSDGGPLTTAVRVVAGNVEVQRNGLQVASTSMPAIASLPLAAAIGALPKPTTEKYFSGSIYPVVVIKGTVTNPEFGIIKDFVDAWVAGTKSFRVTLSGMTGTLNPAVNSVVTITDVGNFNPVISANRTSGVGPLFVLFDALSTQIAPSLASIPFFEVRYDWDFGDAAAASQVWNQGTKSGIASRNVADGPVVGHVFEEGNYTVTLQARFRGILGVLHTKTVTLSISVAATNTLSTVYVSNTALPVAGVGGVPAGANCQLVTSWSSLGALSSTYKRILLKAGESWNANGAAGLVQGPGLLGMYGAGSRPTITAVADDAVIYFNGSSDWRVQDLYITGNGTQGASKRFINGGSGFYGAGGHYLIQRVEMNDTLMGIGLGTCSGAGIVDCYIHDTYDASQGMGGICMYNSSVTELAILGSRFSRSPATHCVRLQGTSRTVIQHSQFDSAGGARNALSIRGMGGSVADGNGYIIWTGKWSENILVSDNIIDNSLISNGGYALYCGPQAIQHAERVRNVIVERNFIKGKDAQAANFQVVSGLVVRGNILVSRIGTVIGVGLGGNIGGSPATIDAKFLNNTIHKPDTSVVASFSPFFLSDSGLGSGLQITNNLVYGPGNNRDGSGNGTQATMYVTGGAVGVPGTNFTLLNNSTEQQLNNVQPWSSSSPLGYADYAPNGYGVNSGIFVPMFSDFFNVEITGSRDMGAIQV